MKTWLTIPVYFKDLSNLYKDIYFLTMMNPNTGKEDFRLGMHKFLDIVIDKVDDKYADHIESMRRDISKIKRLDGL